MTRAKDISKIITDADFSGTLDVTGDLTVDTNTLKVDSSNNYVGIGIASPSATLHLDASGGAFMKLERTGQGHLFLSTDGTNGSIRTSSASGALKFQTNGNNERMRIDASGNVSIGTTSGSAGLTVETSKNDNWAGRFENTLNTGFGGLFVTAGASSAETAFEVRKNTSDTALKILGNGNVGIGISTPDNTLHVHTGSAGAVTANVDFDDLVVESNGNMGMSFLSPNNTFQQIGFGDADDNDIGRIVYQHTNDSMQFNVNGSERMRIDSSGNVGIGTTSPAELLEVHGNTPTIKLRDTSAYSAGTGPNISFQGNDSGGVIKQFADIQGLSLTSNNGVLAFSTRSGGTVAERVRITDVGRVGIGETSPDTPLHVTYTKNVAYSIDNFTQEAQVGLKIENTSSTANAMSVMQFRIGSGADLFFGAEQKSGNDGDFVFGNQNSTDIEMARITNRPCLVVGSSSDTDARIYGTRGDAGSSGFFESTSSATSGVRAISTSLNQNSNNTNCQHLRSTTQNVATFTLNGNGSSTFSSDERLKKNIVTTRDGYLEDLAKLRVVKYNWHCDDDSTDKELGLIAQEVQKVFPKLIVEDDVELNGIEKPLAIKNSVLPMMLLKALQEANTKITALEARITELETA